MNRRKWRWGISMHISRSTTVGSVSPHCRLFGHAQVGTCYTTADITLEIYYANVTVLICVPPLIRGQKKRIRLNGW